MPGHVEDRLLDYLYEELEDGEQGAVQAHLEDCPRCQAAFDELAGTRSLMAALPQEDPERGTEFLVQSAQRELRLREQRPVGALARFGAWIAHHPVSTSLAVAGMAVVVVVGVGQSRSWDLELKAAQAPATIAPAPEAKGAPAAGAAPVDSLAQGGEAAQTAADEHRSLKTFKGLPAGPGSGGGGTTLLPPAPKAGKADKAAQANAALLDAQDRKRAADAAKAKAKAAFLQASKRKAPPPSKAQADLLAKEGENLQTDHGRHEARKWSGARMARIEVVRAGHQEQAKKQASSKPKAAPREKPKAALRQKAPAAQKDVPRADDQGFVGGIVGGAGMGGAAPTPAPSSAPAAKADRAAPPPAPPAAARGTATGATGSADAERAPARHRARHHTRYHARRQARAPATERTRTAAAPTRAAAAPQGPSAVPSGRTAPRPPELERAVHLLDAGVPKKALPLLDALLARPEAPWTPQARYERCRARAALGQRREAEADCRRAVSAGGPFAARARHLLLVLEASGTGSP